FLHMMQWSGKRSYHRQHTVYARGRLDALGLQGFRFCLVCDVRHGIVSRLVSYHILALVCMPIHFPSLPLCISALCPLQIGLIKHWNELRDTSRTSSIMLRT